MPRSFHARYARTIITILVVSTPVVGWGVNWAFELASNNIKQWLPKDFEETRVYEDFCRLFGTDDFALVSWDGCTVDDPRLEQFARALVPSPDRPPSGDKSQRFKSVLTGAEALAAMTAEPFGLPREEALRRLEGTLVGPGRNTCALVTYSEFGNLNRPATLEVLEEIAVSQCGIDPQDLHLGGSTIYNTAIDIESERAIYTWITVAAIVALVVTWRCLRSVKLTAIVLIVAAYSGGLATATVYYTGGTMNLVLVVLPVLVYVLTLSASVHLSNYYRDVLRESGSAGAPQKALARGWAPCTLSAVTTALGLGSLYVSHIMPVKMFGLYSSVGVLLSLGVLFLVLPAAMELWPLAPESAGSGAAASGRRGRRLLSKAVARIIRYRMAVVAVCLVSLVFVGSGVAMVRTSLRPLRLFSPQSRWIRDAAWFEKHLGSLIPIEVELAFNTNSSLSFLDRMELVDQVASVVEKIDFVGGTMSAATFGLPSESLAQAEGPPSRPGSMGGVLAKIMGLGRRDAIRRQVLNKRLLEHRDVFVKRGFLNHDGFREIWRLSVRLEVLNDLEYDDMLHAIVAKVDAALADRKLGFDVVRPIYTGLIPLAQVGQEELLSGLFKSFCLALAMIALVMVVLLRSLPAGLMAMLPNVFPTLVTFGAMGWLATRVDIGAMMTASVALGIAVDDTLHFLTWYRRAIAAGNRRYRAIIVAYRRCAPAMIQTTLIAGLGLVVFYFSSFQPTSQFGLLMFILLLMALVGDLVFLPALLATRFGERFARRKSTGK